MQNTHTHMQDLLKVLCDMLQAVSSHTDPASVRVGLAQLL